MALVFNLLTITALFFMLRYRVHIHITYQPKATGRRRQVEKPAANNATTSTTEQLLTDTLINQGIRNKAKARAAARRAIATNPGPVTIDRLVIAAIKEAREAA